MPACYMSWDEEALIVDVNYCLYRLNEDTGQVISLGRNTCRQIIQQEGALWSAIDPGHWPAVEGVTCNIEVVATSATHCLYNIPVRIGTTNWSLRCGRLYSRYLNETNLEQESASEYIIYGVWEGYDDNTDVPNRNNLPLAQLAGQEFRLLYPVDNAAASGRTTYESSDSLTIYRVLKVEEQALSPGTYYLDYDIIDIFHRRYELERIEFYWDGENFTYPEDLNWEGTVALSTSSDGSQP